MAWRSKKLNDILWLANGIAFVVVINLLASSYFFRWDLTEEKRYTIKKPTQDLLNNLDDDVYVEVFLAGDLNAGFKKLQRSIREILEELRILSHNRIHYSFTNPALAKSAKSRGEFMRYLVAKGIEPINVIDRKEGQRMEKVVFPGALISYGGFEKGVMLLKGNRAQKSDEVLNQSIEGLEFELANALYQLTNSNRKRIGLLTGHGELSGIEMASFNNALWNQYDVFSLNLDKKEAIENYDALIVAKPTKPFSELDKWKLDQYVMRGGRLLLLVDVMNAVMDSASREDYYALPYRLGLSDLLFRYGLRIDLNLIQDKISAKFPIVVDNRSPIKVLPWPFFPLISRYSDHVITRNLDASLFRFTSSIDTVRAKGVKKTPLLFSSSLSRKVGAPVKISVNDLRTSTDPALFKEGAFAVGYLLEGRFTSLYKNRIPPTGMSNTSSGRQSGLSKIVVLADGDVARNEINKQTGKPQQLGYDPVSAYTFANEMLLMNTVAYLTDETGLITVRNKEFKIRPLNKKAIREDRLFWQVINVALPFFIFFVYGVVRWYVRKRRYTTH